MGELIISAVIPTSELQKVRRDDRPNVYRAIVDGKVRYANQRGEVDLPVGSLLEINDIAESIGVAGDQKINSYGK